MSNRIHHDYHQQDTFHLIYISNIQFDRFKPIKGIVYAFFMQLVLVSINWLLVVRPYFLKNLNRIITNLLNFSYR